MAHFGQMCEFDYRKKRALRFSVLRHLRLYSPKQRDALYMHFTPDRNTEIEEVLKYLRDQKYIEIGKDKMVRITASGRRHLEEQL